MSMSVTNHENKFQMSLEWKLVSITYNVNRQRPTKESIQSWLNFEDIEAAQIVSFAMQEVPNAEVFKATPTHNTWSEQLIFWMRERNFSLVNKLCLASNMLLIFTKLDTLQHIEQIDDRWCRSSLLGTIGFKGTISTRIILRSKIVLIFITSHLFPDERGNNERIKQYNESLYCTFPEDKSSRRFTIWMGDMNFRIEGFTNSAQMISMLNNLEDIDELARISDNYDQLKKAKKAGQIFSGFHEDIIRFKPTYRILVGSGSYDPLRIPSWCDRILYRASANDELISERYYSCRKITLSDHFPVTAHFTLRLGCQLDSSEHGWPCSFEHIPPWEELIPLVCRLRIQTDFWNKYGTNFDWIGVYPASVEMISRPILWIYLLTCPFDDRRRIVAEFQPLEPGAYRIGYFCSQKRCLQALSNPFPVRSVQERY